MEIREVGEKLSKSFKGNGKYIVLGLAGVGAVLLLSNRSTTEDSGQWVTPTGYTSYPDAVTNANVIMDEVNNHTTAEINGLKTEMVEQFETTNNYVQEGITNILDNAEQNKDQIVDQIVTSEKNVVTNQNKTQPTTNTGQTNISATTQYYQRATYRGNSIVDAFKSIGIYSIGNLNIGNWRSRAEIAKANGISNYTGTASQNTKLLNLLKQGKLKKA